VFLDFKNLLFFHLFTTASPNPINLLFITEFKFFDIFLCFPLISIFSPLFSFLIIFFFGRLISVRGSILFTLLNTFVALTTVLVYVIYFSFIDLSNSFVQEFVFFDWFNLITFKIQWGFYFDTLALLMICVVLFITLLVQIYCVDYMWGDPFINKFYAYLSLFAFFMLFLVSSNNYIQIFLGWEGVGLVSFLLISFWNTRKDAVLAGVKAMLVNRIGDIFFIFACVVMLAKFKTLNFLDLFYINFFIDSYLDFELCFFCFALILAAMAKSAQLGLHTWLPDAMEGPTPVSALIHAATMVTAGIFVIVRSSPLLVFNTFALDSMAIIGGLTAVFGASVAATQMDIKKIVAYSTCSQLGYMMLACGTGNFAGAMFHLFTHAFFKALLFLSAGSIIHAMSNEQDLRRMGGLYRFLPFTYICMFLGSLSLMGFPFFSGFYSKDNILETAFLCDRAAAYLGFLFGVIAAFFTAFYSFRLLYWVFFAPYSGPRNRITSIGEAPFYMSVAMFSLIFPTIFFGFIFSDYFVGINSAFFWLDSIYLNFNFSIYSTAYTIDGFIRQLPLISTLLGFLLSIYYNFYNIFYFNKIIKRSYLYRFASRKWYFDDLYNFFIRKIGNYIYVYYWMSVEKGLFEYFGPRFFINLFRCIANWFLQFFENKKISSVGFYFYRLFFSFAVLGVFYSAVNSLYFFYLSSTEIDIFFGAAYMAFLLFFLFVCFFYFEKDK
jgi:NADH-quinone oxidoreductase subunit L